MDRRKFVLLEAIKTAALAGSEIRLYQRGKVPGLFAQRTRENAEVASQAVRDNLLEIVRAETIGKSTVEWVSVTQKGLDFLLQSESPARAIDELRSALALNDNGVPAWLTEMHARLDILAQQCAGEIEQVRVRLDQVAQRAEEAMQRIEQARAPQTVPWAQDALEVMERRRQVGLGERCSLGDLYAALKEHHHALTIRDFHQGLKRLHDRQLLALSADTPNGDAPGPEYALLDGPAVYYYVKRAILPGQ